MEVLAILINYYYWTSQYKHDCYAYKEGTNTVNHCVIIAQLIRSLLIGKQSGGRGGVLDQYLGIGELLRVWNPDPV